MDEVLHCASARLNGFARWSNFFWPVPSVCGPCCASLWWMKEEAKVGLSYSVWSQIYRSLWFQLRCWCELYLLSDTVNYSKPYVKEMHPETSSNPPLFHLILTSQYQKTKSNKKTLTQNWKLSKAKKLCHPKIICQCNKHLQIASLKQD